MNLRDQVVAITGASRGIGLATAKEFAKNRVHLILASRSFPEGIKEELLSLGAQSVEWQNVDFTEAKDTSAWADHIIAKKVDILFNNAGLLTGGLFEKQPLEDIEKMLQVNLNAVIRLCHKVVPHMLERGSGKIINNASVSGRFFLPCASTYAASKAAVVAFTECLQQELEGTGVSTLLLITPGVKTDMYDQISDLYGENLNLENLSSIQSDEWAQKIIECVSDETRICQPPLASRVLIKTYQNLPSLFKRMVSKQFHR